MTVRFDTPLLTLSQVKEWEARKIELEQQVRSMQEELAAIVRKLEAANVFVRMRNGDIEPLDVVRDAASADGEQGTSETIGDAIIRVVANFQGKTMQPVQIKAALKSSGFDMTKLDANPGYLYTVLGRLLKRGKLEKRRGAYRATARSSSPNGETGVVGTPAHS